MARRGLLRLDDPLLAAQHFNWLVLSIPLNAAMFRPADPPAPAEDLQRYADEAVRIFLAAYSDDPDRTSSAGSTVDYGAPTAGG